MSNRFTNAMLVALASALIALAAQNAQKAEKKAGAEEAKPLPLQAPFDVSSYFFPSGWMGNFEDKEKGKKLLDVNTVFKGKPRQGSSTGLCTRISYKGTTWAGIYWQGPDGNWGDKPGRTVTGASRVTFWAAGEQGGEVVEFKAGGSGTGSKYPDSFEATWETRALARDWTPYEISLTNKNLSNVAGAFACIMHADSARSGSTIYIDRIRFE